MGSPWLKNEDDFLSEDQVRMDAPCDHEETMKIRLHECRQRGLQVGAGWGENPLSR
jgi:hypothetical protein